MPHPIFSYKYFYDYFVQKKSVILSAWYVLYVYGKIFLEPLPIYTYVYVYICTYLEA